MLAHALDLETVPVDAIHEVIKGTYSIAYFVPHLRDLCVGLFFELLILLVNPVDCFVRAILHDVELVSQLFCSFVLNFLEPSSLWLNCFEFRSVGSDEYFLNFHEWSVRSGSILSH